MSTRRDIASFYDNWVPDQVKIGLNRRHYLIFELLRKNGLRRSDNVLEIGCGVGPVTRLLSRYLGNGHVTGVDISPKSIEQARKNLNGRRNVELVVSDMSDFPAKKSFDVIALPDVLEHIPYESHMNLFKTLSAVLSKTGFILIHIPDPSYQDWVRAKHPERLQIVDHSLYVETIAGPISANGLYVSSLSSHSIFHAGGDYQVMIVRRKTLRAEFPHRNRILLTIEKFLSQVRYRTALCFSQLQDR